MKKIILSAIAVLAFGFANAQDGKGFNNGDAFISGSLGFNSTSIGDNSTTGFSVSPKFGFFVTSNIAVGAAFGFEGRTTNTGLPLAKDVKNNTFTAGVFGRYYATPASDFSVFGELGVNYSTSKPDGGTTTNGFGVALAPGISYFVSKHFALETTIGVLSYDTKKLDVNGAEATNSFNVGLGITDIKLGLVYKF